MSAAPPHSGPPAPDLLPILQRRDEITRAILSHQVVVICGETGSGKTTQLPQICLDLNLAQNGLIGHTQPRRLAARAVAARIAEERGVRLGGLVGVKVRFQDQTGPQTRIKVLTDGMLLTELTGDPGLHRYSTIIIDEAHERSLNVDFLLGYLRGLLPRRKDLKLIITSATIDPARFSTYFGGPQMAPVIEVSGRTYPVTYEYRPGDEEEEDSGRAPQTDFEAVADAVEDLLRPSRPTGDVLVFLPGEREIRLAGDAIARRRLKADVLPLFSRLTNEEQDRIFHPGERQRVILTTNVAETSLTVPRIHYVVDTGLARLNRYDAARKIQKLPIEPISRASANQRAGRCGRIAAGVCIRLYSEESYRSRPAFTEPEIRRTNLAGVILRMKSLGEHLGPIEEFAFLDAPDLAAIKDGYETLFELGAMTEPSGTGTLTPTGERMSQIPVDPRIARILLAAEPEGALDEAIVLAAVLSIQDPRERPMARQEEADRAHTVFRHESSDFLTLLKIYDQYQFAADNNGSGALMGWCRQHFLSAARMREWTDMIRQLRDIASDLDLRRSKTAANEDAIHRSLLTGLISNVACRETDGRGQGSFDYRAVRGNTAQIFPGSVLFKKNPRWIMSAELVQTTRLYARTVARIEPEWIEDLAGHMFRHQYSDQHLDAETGEPSAWERVTMSGIVVVPRRRASLEAQEPALARKLFLTEGLAQGKWKVDADFARHNQHVREHAQKAEAKLRRRDVLAPGEQLSAWFDQRVPREICGPAGFNRWRIEAEKANPGVLNLGEADVLLPSARAAFDTTKYPDHLEYGSHRFPLEYIFSTGRMDDGVTVSVEVGDLPALPPHRPEWLTPGMLAELIQSLVKQLPKQTRSRLEAKAGADALANGLAGVLSFGSGPLGDALSEAVEVLHGVKIAPEQWNFKSLPAHLRMRIRVVDSSGRDLGFERDMPTVLERFAGRIKKARAAADRAGFERHGLTTWDFPELPPQVEQEADGLTTTGYPALVDQGDAVSLTLLGSAHEAALRTGFGVRRLFAIACREEVGYYIDALPGWSDMTRHFNALGTANELRDQLTCLIAERVFMDGQPAIQTREQYEERRSSQWGRLSTVARETGETIAKTLEPRFRVAHRIASGTPRLWADNVADIREHAAYLMPRGFLGLLPWERLKRYPKYAEGMRERLFALREDGSKAETAAMPRFLPHWKLFTGWVAQTMSAARIAAEEPPKSGSTTEKKSKAPLPQTRRTGATVNLDAGEWALQPGNLPPTMLAYRWALEDLRLALFAPDLAFKPSPTVEDLAAMWKKVSPGPRDK